MLFSQRAAITCLITLAIASPVFSQENKNTPALSARYTSGGFQIETSDKKYSANIGLRFQPRFYTRFDSEPGSEEEFSEGATPTLMMRRARFKIDGNIFKPSIGYKFEYDFMTARLIDIYFSFQKLKFLSLRVGQYKALYNRERVISSGNGLMIERSIVNSPFTLDRQVGGTLYGTLGGPSPANFTYYLSAHTGAGAHAAINDDNKLLYIGRLEWNVFGGGIPISEDDADTEISQKPAATIGIAAASNSSSFNRFDSGEGGVLLDGYTSALAGQYRSGQYLQDFILNYKGFSLMQEYHYKEVEDRIANTTQKMKGFFAQAGFFPSVALKKLPEEMQLVFRYAWLDQDTEIPLNINHEYTAGVNWYFAGKFNNRLQADFSLLEMTLIDRALNTTRFRLQWDVTF